MKRKNKPTDTYLSEHGFTTFDGNKKTFNVYEGHSLRFLYSEEFISKGYDEVRLIKKDRTCPECGCNSVKNGSYGINLNKNQEIRIEGYKCNNCENTHYFYASQYADVDKSCTYDRELRNLQIKFSLIEHFSNDKLSEIIEALTGISINRETVYYFTDENIDDFIEELMEKQRLEIEALHIKPSGHYGYDEQYIFINGILFMRMTILDNQNNLIINEDIVNFEEFNKETIEEFLRTSLDGKDIISITTDGNNAYPSIIEALRAIQHRFIFHSLQNLTDDTEKDKRILNNKIEYQRKVRKSTDTFILKSITSTLMN